MTTTQDQEITFDQLSVPGIDVGYGNVKLVLRHSEFGIIECDIFPSLAPISSGKGLSAGILKGRDTVMLTGDTDYEVGHNVYMAQGAGDESISLDKKFCLTDGYLARLRGALFYLRSPDKQATLANLWPCTADEYRQWANGDWDAN